MVHANADVFRQDISDDALEAMAGTSAGKSLKTDAGSGWCCGDTTIGTTCG